MTIGQYGGPYKPGVRDRALLRVSSEDRDRAVEVLQRAFSDGRLDKDEFDARSSRALEAVTFADLDVLVQDLPALGPAYGAAGAPAWAYPAAPAKTNALAITSMVCGIAQFFGFWLLGTVPAIVFGHIARRQIRRTGEQGAGMALAGVILGWAGAALSVLMIIAIVVLVAVARHSAGAP